MLEFLLVVEVGNWQKIDVWVAGIAAVALVIVLGFTIKTANAARDTANEARLANDLAQEEMDIRLAPFISIRDLKGGRAEDTDGQILLNPDPTTGGG